MLLKPLSEASRTELNTELELYRAAAIENVPVFNFFAKNSDRADAIAALRAQHGHPSEKDGVVVFVTEAEYQSLIHAPLGENDPAATEITVLDPRGNPHRTYSLAVHGKLFRELAEQYVSKRPGWSLK